MSKYNTLDVSEPASGVRLVTLSRPAQANALSTEMGHDLLAFWGNLSADETVRVVILTGEGRFFCAGADLKERNGMSDSDWSAQHVMFEAMIRAQLACPVPVIAAINGAAMGGGAEMALACDFAWASETAKIGLPEANLGIIPGLGGTQLVTRAVGERRASELLLSAAHMTAAEALEIGLINRICAPDTLMDEVIAKATLIASKAPLAVRALKAVIHGGAVLPLEQAMALELAHYNQLFRTEDRREGVAAFNEKRPADFKGR